MNNFRHAADSTTTVGNPLLARLRLLLVEGVSFPFSFQFLTRLATVFTEDIGGYAQ